MKLSKITMAVAMLAWAPIPVLMPTQSSATSVPTLSAHMGLHYPFSAYPENSLAAEIAAFNVHAPLVETDIKFSKATKTYPYGVPVILHDGTVDSMTKYKGYAYNYTKRQLTGMSLRQAPNSAVFTTQHIPTLAQYLWEARYHHGHVNVEIGLSKLSAGQARVFISVWKAYGADSYGIISSFFPSILAQLRALDSHLAIGSEAYYTSSSQTISKDPWAGMLYTALSAAEVATLHASGHEVEAWVVDNSSDWATMSSFGVDRIATNDVLGYEKWTASQ